MLERLDQHLLLFINSSNSPFLDQVMHALSEKLIWIPLYLAILIYLGITYKRKFLIILLFIILAITVSDQVSVLLKNLTHRLRPCHTPCHNGNYPPGGWRMRRTLQLCFFTRLKLIQCSPAEPAFY